MINVLFWSSYSWYFIKSKSAIQKEILESEIISGLFGNNKVCLKLLCLISVPDKRVHKYAFLNFVNIFSATPFLYSKTFFYDLKHSLKCLWVQFISIFQKSAYWKCGVWIFCGEFIIPFKKTNIIQHQCYQQYSENNFNQEKIDFD